MHGGVGCTLCIDKLIDVRVGRRVCVCGGGSSCVWGEPPLVYQPPKQARMGAARRWGAWGARLTPTPSESLVSPLPYICPQTVGDDNGKTTRLSQLLHKMLEEVDEPQLMELAAR